MTPLPSERRRKRQKKDTFSKLSHRFEITKNKLDSLIPLLRSLEMKNQKETIETWTTETALQEADRSEISMHNGQTVAPQIPSVWLRSERVTYLGGANFLQNSSY